MADRGVGAQPSVCPPDFFGNSGMLHREAPDMHFINQRAVPRRAWRTVSAPAKGGVDHRSQRSTAGVVPLVEREIRRRVADAIREHAIRPADVTADCLGVRVEQYLVVIEAVPGRWVIGALDSIT